MGNKKVTDLGAITTAPLSGVMHFVDTTDATQNAAGSSFKVTKEDFLKENTAAILLNTAKVGITTTQASAITTNSSKVGYTDALVAAAPTVVANTAKVGISSTQASAITANTAKIGYSEALVNANSNVTANTAKVGYTEGLVNANASVVANSAKVGITPAQASAITNNTNKVGFTDDLVKTYDTVFLKSSTILETYPLLSSFVKSIKITGRKADVNKNWVLTGFSNGNLNDGVNRPNVRISDGTTTTTITFATRTSNNVYLAYFTRSEGNIEFNISLSLNSLTNVGVTIADLTISVLDFKKIIEYKDQYTKHPIAFCKSKTLYDDTLIGIDDLSVFGVPSDNDVYINRNYLSAGNYRIELTYADMTSLDGTTFNFLYRNDVVNLDLVTDQSTRIEFENNVAGSTARAIMYVNFSKINTSRTDTSSQISNMRFSKSCIKNTYPVTADIVLPTIIPAVVSYPFRICYESAVTNGTKNEIIGKGYNVTSNRGGGKYYNKIYNSTTSESLKVRLNFGNEFIKFKNSTIKPVLASTGTGVTKKIVVCGDSKTDKTTKLAWLVDTLFANDVMNITLLGTQDSGTYPNEGYSGRTVIDLTTAATLNGISNPFYNASLVGTQKFDVGTFIATVGDTPDIVWIDHGANQISLSFTLIKASYDHILANITAYNTANATNIRVVFSVQESASLLPDVSANLESQKAFLVALGRLMVDNYDNRTGEKLFICPQYLNVDLEFDFPFAKVPLLNNIGALVNKTSDSIHPGEQSFTAYSSATNYSLGAQVSNGGNNFVVIKNGISGITPTDDKVNYAIIEPGIGAGYRNIAQAYFNTLKWMQTI